MTTCKHGIKDGTLQINGETVCGECRGYGDDREPELPALAIAHDRCHAFAVRYPGNPQECTWLPAGTSPETLEGIAAIMRWRSRQAAKAKQAVPVVTDEMVSAFLRTLRTDYPKMAAMENYRQAITAALAAMPKGKP